MRTKQAATGKKIPQPNETNSQPAETIAILDKDGIIQKVSPSVYGLLGYQPEELEGTKGFLLLHDVSMQKVESLYNKLQQHPALLMEGLLQFRKKNGKKTGLYVHANNLLNHSGVNGILIHLRHSSPELITDITHPSLIQHIIKINANACIKARQEIAAELHDNVNPTLAALKLIVEYSLNDPEKNFAELEKTPYILNDLIKDIRNLSHSLINKPSENFELYESLNFLFEHFRRCKTLRLVFKYDSKLENLLQYQQKIHLFRILQEQAANIIKHARATKTLISLQYMNGKIIATTRDNGKGFEPNNRRSGIGLSNMLYRVNALGGNMQIRSEIGKGAMIQIQFPVD